MGNRALTPIFKAYDAVLYGMALVAGVLMVGMMLMIVTDVALRNLGYQSSAHLFTFTEYFLLLIPLLGAPWLVREKGHIYIELALGALDARKRARLMRCILVASLAVCATLAWYGAAITVQDFIQGHKDVRSYDMPRWMLMAFMPLAFGMMALEFARLLARGESPYR